ncbi:phospholipase D alpha 1-like [Phragmites australis]|uniref:phospholipase D alpha 1-like n=1 Tax=Phragmites australis TaxID=29695 RepID=UPI002D78EA2D|nr:phospholipase D alpha 1-like [Phragmites australis]
MGSQEEAAGVAAAADVFYLHGVLEATVFEAEHLHNAIHGRIMEATEKMEQSMGVPCLQHSRLYVDVDVGAARVARTREVEFQPTSPVWNQSFRLHCAYPAAAVTFTVKNQHLIGAGVLGAGSVPAARVVSAGQPLECWLDLRSGEHGHETHTPRLRVLLRFLDAERDSCWDAGVRLLRFAGIKPAFFPERTNCSVTLYQNSHLSDKFDPGVRLDGGRAYRPARLWEDLYVAIRDARRFVYVAGWSVSTKITMVRDASRMIPGAEGVTLGELLKRKADEGVAVLVMPWQDKTSVSFLDNAGLMKTHDEETRRFFEGTNVRCFLCPRDADASLTVVQHIEVSAEFTHHQKTVTFDAATPGTDDRHVVSFIGGIDLCDGRYDDEDHTLFGDLDTTYLRDFMQNNYKHACLQRGGPREPWHDVHCRLEGPAAWDVLANFEQRWRKQAPEDMRGDLLQLSTETLPDPVGFDDTDSWNVQVFRSIDDASVEGFPSDPAEASAMGLTCGKDVTMDQSIQVGYVEAIRRARRFIYIENQYFLGGCASWAEDRDAGCLNLVPVEIALKVAAKIRRGERFAAYVVTPMWPEGEPAGEAVQAILRWSRLTVEMMYGIVAKAIDDAGLRGKAHPCDYLNFFCLGNREAPRPGEYTPPEAPEEDTDYWRARVNRRGPIYVHAKLMIVDDEYVIVGSANLNERSLAGNRDSEIAQGSYQPAHLNGPCGRARGQVHGFRMSLWHEHFMGRHTSEDADDAGVFLQPESVECVRAVRRAAGRLWDAYTQDRVEDLPGHLLPFPITVSEFGEVADLPADGCFPDTRAPVRGRKAVKLPDILTT